MVRVSKIKHVTNRYLCTVDRRHTVRVFCAERRLAIERHIMSTLHRDQITRQMSLQQLLTSLHTAAASARLRWRKRTWCWTDLKQRPAPALFLWRVTWTFDLLIRNKWVSGLNLEHTFSDPSCIGFWNISRKNRQTNSVKNSIRATAVGAGMYLPSPSDR